MFDNKYALNSDVDLLVKNAKLHDLVEISPTNGTA